MLFVFPSIAIKAANLCFGSFANLRTALRDTA
jgi:hypothetical protein